MSQDIDINVAGPMAAAFLRAPLLPAGLPPLTTKAAGTAGGLVDQKQATQSSRASRRANQSVRITQTTIVAVMKRWRASRHFGIGATSA